MNEDILKFLEKLDNPRSFDLTRYKVIFYRGNYFEEDLVDRTTPADNITVIQDSSGKRFKANRRSFPLGVLDFQDANNDSIPPEAQRNTGDAYLILPGALRELSLYENRIVIWTIWDEWYDIIPVLGERVYVASTDTDWRWNGFRWEEIPNISTGIPQEGLDFPGWTGIQLEITDSNFSNFTNGSYYLVGVDANTGNDLTGIYATNKNKILHRTSAGTNVFISPKEGMATFNPLTNTMKVFRQGNWETRFEEHTYIYRYLYYGANNTNIASNWTKKTYNGAPGLMVGTLPNIRDLPAINNGPDVYHYEIFAASGTHIDLTFTATARQREEVYLELNLYKGTGANDIITTLARTQPRETIVSNNVSTFRSQNRSTETTGDKTNYSTFWTGNVRPREFRTFPNTVTSSDTLELGIVAAGGDYGSNYSPDTSVNTNSSSFGIDWRVERQLQG